MVECFIKDTCNIYDKDNDCCPYMDTEVRPCMRQYKINYLLDQALLSEAQKTRKALLLDVNKVDLQAFTDLNYIKTHIVSFAKNGNNVYIYSKIPGNGKTSWAIKLIQSFINKVWAESKLTCRVLFINVPKFLLALKASISEQSDYIDHINQYVNSADIVVWDDIGTKVATEFEHEHLLSLIDSRLLDNKSNIFTSNIIPNELSSFVGDRLASRIINTSKTIEFLGMDKRGLKIK